MSQETIEKGSQPLYDEVVSHYKDCHVEKKYLSDTWDHTLKQKGRIFPLPAMRRMLALGNRVNGWIDDSNHLIDKTILDPNDPAALRLVAYGEDEFGEPRRDLRLDGRYYSSNFVHHIFYASKIIHSIEERGIERPVVLEIGGGMGGVAYLLRRYFGDRLTFYAVDLPETLMLQEWYLRGTFPSMPTTFKAGEARVEPVSGGVNFVNAYTLRSQDYPFDVAVNIDSMQEMNVDAISLYIDYMQRNMSDGGIFFFQNHYGHATGSVAEPSEYPLDGRWRVQSAEISPDFEACGCEQARLVYQRVPKAEDIETRRLVLRVLWNGFLSGRLSNNAALVSELSQLPARCRPDGAVPLIAAALKAHGADVSGNLVATLTDSIYFPHQAYLAAVKTAAPIAPASQAFKQRHMDALWRLQSGILQLMRTASEEKSGAKALGELAARQCAAAEPLLGDTAVSEFWSAYFSSIFFALRQNEAASNLLRRCAAQSENPFWLVRFAHLWRRFGQDGEASRLLKRLDTLESGDYYVELKRAELESACGDAARARRLLAAAKAGADDDVVRWTSLARTAARAGDDGLALEAASEALSRSPESAAAIALGVLGASSGKTLHARAAGLTRIVEARERVNDDDEIAQAFLFLELGRRDEALARITASEKRFSADYFRLGLLGRLSLQAGLTEIADRCLRNSAEARPGAFLHYEFIGNVYFGAGRFSQASAFYARSLALKPYLRHLLAKDLYSKLPDDIRRSGVLGQPSDLRLMFQREQNFYHDLGPTSK
ncbi:MAG: putative sugar O-methyltransferase [Elusimicrobia bacterium]|nr:putative sugar O-methyltransferase [Elusimicrobiota bacterium]